MGDKFPKTYVIERLKARKASLQSRLDAGQKVYQDWVESKNPEAEEWLTKTYRKLADLAANPEPESIKVWSRVDKLLSQLASLREKAPQQPSSGWRRDRPQAVEEWLNHRQSWAFEITKIDHGLAYLDEMPVTELNITMITKLKLTDAISFDLRVEQDKRTGQLK